MLLLDTIVPVVYRLYGCLRCFIRSNVPSHMGTQIAPRTSLAIFAAHLTIKWSQHSVRFLATVVIWCLWMIIIPRTEAKLSRAACYGNHCMQLNYRSILCFHPNPDVNATSSCRSATLNAVMNHHIDMSSSPAIPTTAYYDISTLSFLGGPTWSVNGAPVQLNRGLIAVCSTGLVKGSTFLTTCRVSVADEDFEVATAEDSRCDRIHGHDQRVLREACCGPPRTICPPSRESFWYNAKGTLSFSISAVVDMLGRLTLRVFRILV
jgi:hypothetical protein